MALSNSLRSLRQTLWTMLKKPTSSVAVTHRCVRQSAKKSISSQNLQRSQHCAVQPIQLHKRLYSEERNTSETDGVSSLNLESRGTKHSNTTKSKLPHPGHLDYDLDKLLQNIRKAQQSGELAQETAEDRDGRMSAMSIEELVKFLEEEKGEEVCVIRVPPEREYVKYFVTCVGVGGRHLQRMADNLAAEYKRVKDNRGRSLRAVVEGSESEDWVVVLLGDTVVHLMTEETRRLYQLEQLWTLGHRYDNQYRKMEKVNFESDALK